MPDDVLRMRHDAGVCRTCLKHLVLCVFGQCVSCHTAAPHTARAWVGAVRALPVHLCCGWWGPLDVLPWTCPTCGTARGRHP